MIMGKMVQDGILSGKESVSARERAERGDLFALGKICIQTDTIHTVHPLTVDIPKGRLIAVTGVSGSGKTTLILESLVPALQAMVDKESMPAHVKSLSAKGINRVNLIDASPIGANVRSTVATYSNVMDELRKIFAATNTAKERKLKQNDFSYNTGSLRCPECDGTGQITLDVQFLPDVEIVCPKCKGLRYSDAAYEIKIPCAESKDGVSLPDLMGYTITQTLNSLPSKSGALYKKVREKLETLQNLGIGYLTLGEGTPLLSGGEAQRLKLAAEMGRTQSDALYVFDEPTIGLHPLDVRKLIEVFDTLVEEGATVVVIEHDLDVIMNADYIIDMGPGGGEDGGRIVCSGVPEDIASNPDSITGKYLNFST